MPTVKGLSPADRTRQLELHATLAEQSAQLLSSATWGSDADLKVADHLAGAVVAAMERVVAVLDGTPIDDAQLSKLATTAAAVQKATEPLEGRVDPGDYRSQPGPGYAALKAGKSAQQLVAAQQTHRELSAKASEPARPFDVVLQELGGADQDRNELFQAGLSKLVHPEEVGALLIHLAEHHGVGIDNARYAASEHVSTARQPFWEQGVKVLAKHLQEKAAALSQEMETKFGAPVVHASLSGGVDSVAEQLSKLAEDEQKPQAYDFNSKTLIAYPGEEAAAVVDRWRAAPYND